MDHRGRFLGRIFLACVVALLFPVWANALEAGIEDAYVKIIANPFGGGPVPDVDTLDDNADGVVDRAQFRLLDTLLREDSAPHHAEILAAYQANLARFVQDNTLGVRCVFMEAIYHFTCDDFNKHSAGTFTLAEPVAVQTLVAEFSANAEITLNPANYNLSLANLLPGSADLDGDGYTNAQEFAAVCGNIDAYVSAVKDPAQNPATLPCCANCVLHILAEPQDAQAYVNQSLTLSVAVKDSEGAVHYHWYRGGATVGADAPELAFGSLGLADSGQYRCVITDASETVTSRTAQLTVADHMKITRQPQSAKRHIGDSHTFTVTLSGGLPPLRRQWVKEGTTVGADASQLALAEITANDAGIYWCVITDLREQIMSEQFELTVLPPGEGEDGGEGEIVPEGEVVVEGEALVEGEVVVEGEGEGEGLVEGEIVREGEIPVEGEVAGEGEGVIDVGGGCLGGAGDLKTLSILAAANFLFFLLGWRSGTR